MVKEQRENCAIEGWDRESLIESALFIQLLYYTKVLSTPLETSRNLLEIGAELIEIIGNFAPSD